MKYFLYILLLLASIVVFVHISVDRNSSEVWFRTNDQDGALIIDCLRVNAGRVPEFLSHPSHGTYIIYSTAFKMLRSLDVIKTSQFTQLEESDDPLMLLPEVFLAGRSISIFLCIVCALLFGCIFGILGKRLCDFVLGTIIFLFSGGLFFQSLVIRSELCSALFLILCIFFLVLDFKSKTPTSKIICRFFVGISFGLALLTKVHVIPAGFLIAIYYYAETNRKQHRHKVGIPKIALLVCYYLFLFFLALAILRVYKADELSFRDILLIPILILIALGELLHFFPRIRQYRLCCFISKMPILMVGFLMAFQISFYFLNFNDNSDNKELLVKAGAYHKIFNPDHLFTKRYAKSFERGTLVNQFVMFLKYYSIHTFIFTIIMLMALYIIFLYRKRPPPIAMLSFAFGIGFCLFSSVRYFGEHYLLYPDIFFVGAFMFLYMQVRNEYGNQKLLHKKITIALIPVLGVVFFLMLISQHKYLSSRYCRCTNTSNRPDLVHSFVMCAEEYKKLMLDKYESRENITRKVCSDPYLNGTFRGIDISKKQNVRKYCAEYFPENKE